MLRETWRRLLLVAKGAKRTSLDLTKNFEKRKIPFLLKMEDALKMNRNSYPRNEQIPSHFLIPSNSEMDKIEEIRNSFLTPIPTKGGFVGYLETVATLLRSFPLVRKMKNQNPRLLGRKLCIVGVHGWFPTKVLQTVVGVPKGTSERLCRMMTLNAQEYFNLTPLSYFENPMDISCVPLEGAGCIDERVNLHFSQLDEYVNGILEGGDTERKGRDLIKQADSVIFVAHSQGAPVTTLLMERMLEEGIIKPKQQNIGILSLAGVFHGPLPTLKENLVVKYVEADAARELFDLNDPNGELSTRIQRSITKLLSEDVKFSCIASWMDQVVPLYSATLLGIDHPNIWRSIYIDSHNYKPDFLSNFVCFLLKIVNAQVNGSRELLGHMTESLEGSLYQSNAHSTLYDDNGVYQGILKWMTTLHRGNSEAKLCPSEMISHINGNPYKLPWIMRGMLDQISVSEKMNSEIGQLKRLLLEWKPNRKVWRQLKLQLEPLSKL